MKTVILLFIDGISLIIVGVVSNLLIGSIVGAILIFSGLLYILFDGYL